MGLIGKSAGLQPRIKSPMMQGGKIHVSRNILFADMIVRRMVDTMPVITDKGTRIPVFFIQIGRGISVIDGQYESLFEGLGYFPDPVYGFQVDLRPESP